MASYGEVPMEGCAQGLSHGVGMESGITFLECETGMDCPHKDKHCI